MKDIVIFDTTESMKDATFSEVIIGVVYKKPDILVTVVNESSMIRSSSYFRMENVDACIVEFGNKEHDAASLIGGCSDIHLHGHITRVVGTISEYNKEIEHDRVHNPNTGRVVVYREI